MLINKPALPCSSSLFCSWRHNISRCFCRGDNWDYDEKLRAQDKLKRLITTIFLRCWCACVFQLSDISDVQQKRLKKQLQHLVTCRICVKSQTCCFSGSVLLSAEPSGKTATRHVDIRARSDIELHMEQQQACDYRLAGAATWISLKKVWEQIVVGGGICWGRLRTVKRRRSSPAVFPPLVSEDLITAVVSATQPRCKHTHQAVCFPRLQGTFNIPEPFAKTLCWRPGHSLWVCAHACMHSAFSSPRPGLDGVICQKVWKGSDYCLCCLMPPFIPNILVKVQIFRIALLQVQ